eukprot:COSAG03_NODE_1133_length_4748_cov_9.980426_3_plen_154_part_00
MKLSQLDTGVKELLGSLGYTNKQWDNTENRTRLAGYITVRAGKLPPSQQIIWVQLAGAIGLQLKKEQLPGIDVPAQLEAGHKSMLKEVQHMSQYTGSIAGFLRSGTKHIGAPPALLKRLKEGWITVLLDQPAFFSTAISRGGGQKPDLNGAAH